MNQKSFLTFLLICSILALCSSIVFSILNCISANNISSDIKTIEQNITNTENLKNASSSWGAFEKAQFHDSIYTQLINWKGQGTINWGLGFLASITVFFTILFGLRTKDEENSKSDGILECLGCIFLVASILSVFQLAYYYRYVGALQSHLVTIPFVKSLLYDVIATWWGIELGMILISFVFVCLTYRERAKVLALKP
jgi:uncharacterized membrane protein